MIKPTNNELLILNPYLSSNIDKQQKQFQQLQQYVEMVLNYNNKHNLIGKNTISNIWSRHILDSLQLVPFIKTANNISQTIVDLGSGAGFPAVVLGIITGYKIIMVEKSPVKAQFLSRVCQELKLDYQIVNEAISKQNINKFLPKNAILTSRAFKSVGDIFNLIDNNNTINKIDKIVLLKGSKWVEEINNYINSQNHNNTKPSDNKFSIKFLNKFKLKTTQSILSEGVVLLFE